jgi:hypothetical protein
MNKIRDFLDLGETEKRAHLYPTYYIFDRQGKPVVKNANLPSTGQLLYKQLDSVLQIPNKD